MHSVIKPTGYEKFAIESFLWSFLHLTKLTHFADLCRINERNDESIKEVSVLSWEISFQRDTTLVKGHLPFILPQEAASHSTKFVALMKILGVVVSEPLDVFI